MAIRTKFQIIAECDELDCVNKKFGEEYEGRYLVPLEYESSELVTEFLLGICEPGGWQSERESYEEIRLTCPACVIRRNDNHSKDRDNSVEQAA